MRFFCCCQSNQRTPCLNCAAGGFGNPPGANASCPAGVSCGTANTGGLFGGTYTTCLAPLDHPCCGTYTFTASGYIYPRWCKDDGTGQCVPGSSTARNVVSYSRTRCDSNPPCVNPQIEQGCTVYRSIDSVGWSVTQTANSYEPPGNPGFCDIDGKVVANPAPVTTTTINGDWRTDVQVQAVWTCRGIQITVNASWLVRCCEAVVAGGGGVVLQCVWRGCCTASISAGYSLSPGTGNCNIDGNYVLVSTNTPSIFSLNEWHLDDISPQSGPGDCTGCYEFGGAMQCGYLSSHPFGWRLDNDAMLAGLPTAIQVIRT